jgi:YD repeat-containing protein
MINYEAIADMVKTTGVLYSQPESIRRLAIMMMVNAAEANTDMIYDCLEEYKSKEDIEGAFQALNEVALDCLEDHINDLRLSLDKFLRSTKVTARVRRLDYDKEGKLSEITLDIDVE